MPTKKPDKDSTQIVQKIAKISRLNLTEQEIKEISSDFSTILSAFDEMKSAKTNGVEPSFHPIDLKNALREDKPEKCLDPETALSNAEQKKDGYIKGPRAV